MVSFVLEAGPPIKVNSSRFPFADARFSLSFLSHSAASATTTMATEIIGERAAGGMGCRSEQGRKDYIGMPGAKLM